MDDPFYIKEYHTMSASHYHTMKFTSPHLITYEELNLHDQQNKRHALSMLSIGTKREIRGLCYWTIESATQWFLTQQNTQDLRTMTPYLGSMDRIRYHHALRQLTRDDWIPSTADLPRLFYQALLAPTSLNPLDLLTVHLFVHMDDVGILSEWAHESQRVAATVALAAATPGSWLLRRSSVKDSDIIKTRALCIKDKRTAHTQHILIAHIDGFGYAHLTGVQSFQQMPYSDGRAIPSSIMEPSYMIPTPPLPAIQNLAGSFLDLLHSYEHMMDVDKRL
jgi:hypothetical protein